MNRTTTSAPPGTACARHPTRVRTTRSSPANLGLRGQQCLKAIAKYQMFAHLTSTHSTCTATRIRGSDWFSTMPGQASLHYSGRSPTACHFSEMGSLGGGGGRRWLFSVFWAFDGAPASRSVLATTLLQTAAHPTRQSRSSRRPVTMDLAKGGRPELKSDDRQGSPSCTEFCKRKKEKPYSGPFQAAGNPELQPIYMVQGCPRLAQSAFRHLQYGPPCPASCGVVLHNFHASLFFVSTLRKSPRAGHCFV